MISNNHLIILIVFTIFVSLLGTWNTINKLDGMTQGVTGAAIGWVNVSVNETIGITMITSFVNFTSAAPGSSRATVIAGDYTSGPINITNDGSVDINISITDSETLFNSPTLVRSKHYLYNITKASYGGATYDHCSLNQANGIAYTLGGWRAFPSSGSETPICRLNYTDGKDSVKVDINITFPSDESGGQKDAMITFTASISG